ncbi:hypothetical protein D9M68_639630 [compost metagenome]
MGHHGVVDQGDAQALAVLQNQRFRVGKGNAVEGPGEAFHVPREVQFDGAARLAAVRVGEGAAQVGVGQYPAAVVTQADAGVRQLGRRGHGLHVHQRVVGFRCRVGLHLAAHAGHLGVVHTRLLRVVHAGHLRMVHARHLRVVHAGHLGMVHARHLRVVHAGHLRMIHAGHLGMVHARHLRVVHAGHLGMVHTRHLRVVHTRHVAMPHGAVIHAHVGHADQWARVRLRHQGTQAFAHGEGTAGVAGAVHGLGKNRVGLVARGLHQHVVGFGDGDAEFIHAHRFDRLAVGRDNGQFQAGNAYVEVGHRRAVDEAQADLLARLE